MGAIAYEAALDKESMAEELAINYATFDDILETGADFEAVNSIIDSYNLSHSVQADRFSAAEALLKQPYFAKLSLAYERDGKTKELYIGVAGISDENYKRIIVDWRSPVAEVYYTQATGKTSYMADGRTISVDVKLRRQFDIERDILKGYFDSDVVIEDSLLLSSLARHRSAHMKDITATIQKEQNVVIRHDDVGALLVSGIAGSGKTSVLLQRIAYLFYQKRGSLKPEEVVLITPNPVFRRYIDHVLPDLGERNPNLLTYEEFMSPLLPKGRGVGSASAGLDAIEAIDKAMEGFDFLPQDFLPIVIHHVKLLGEDQVWKASQKYSYIEAGPHRAALIREALIARLDARLAQLASVEEIHNEVESLSVEDQLRLFDEMYEPQTEKEEREAALIYLKDRFKDGYAAIERDDWLNVDGLGKRLLHSHGLTSPEWLYLKMSVTGLGEPSIKYVMIDEVQDYNAAQIAVLAKYYRRAHFLLLGDPNQAIFENTASFDTISEVFARTSGNIERCDLITSYRSTPAITRLFASLLPSGHKGAYTSVLRDEDSPVIIEYDDHDNYIDHLRSLVRLTGEEGGLCAFIVLWKQDAKRLQGMLGEDAPMVIG
ncbi:MAG: UvrD-helicase domain-containing protein, partial [Eggerthellaceae bacterium]|nr:UvrD-helicase domain-containing protein [Eggerthellaceae bacterium]